MSTFTSDPAALQSAIDKVNEEPAVKIETVAPSNGEVILPGGFIAGDGSLIKYAEVRELNGADEEAISKAGTTGKALLMMLQRGLVSLGASPATREDLDKLLSGDRDAILVGIRRVTFGDTVEFEFPCSSCRERLHVTVDLLADVPSRSLDNPITDRHLEYESKKHGIIKYSLPTGAVQKKLLENTDKTRAELNTILLASCVDSINGAPSLGATSVLKLGMADRDALVDGIVSHNPGPRLGEVSTTCEACGEELPMPLSLADLFRL